jgi:hypothetical protein
MKNISHNSSGFSYVCPVLTFIKFRSAKPGSWINLMDCEFEVVWAAINLCVKAARDFAVFLAVGVLFPEEVQIHVTKEG